MAQVFLCFRVLILRMSAHHLTSLWPTVITEIVCLLCHLSSTPQSPISKTQLPPPSPRHQPLTSLWTTVLIPSQHLTPPPPTPDFLHLCRLHSSSKWYVILISLPQNPKCVPGFTHPCRPYNFGIALVGKAIWVLSPGWICPQARAKQICTVGTLLSLINTPRIQEVHKDWLSA